MTITPGTTVHVDPPAPEPEHVEVTVPVDVTIEAPPEPEPAELVDSLAVVEHMRTTAEEVAEARLGEHTSRHPHTEGLSESRVREIAAEELNRLLEEDAEPTLVGPDLPDLELPDPSDLTIVTPDIPDEPAEPPGGVYRHLKRLGW